MNKFKLKRILPLVMEVLSNSEKGSKINLKNKVENPKTVEGYIKKIKGNEKWMESIKIKAKKRNISIEEMVETDEKYSLKQDNM